MKVKKVWEKSPYDLLITDLSFDTDHREQTLKTGKNLWMPLKKRHPY
jgi:hypothetical protein